MPFEEFHSHEEAANPEEFHNPANPEKVGGSKKLDIGDGATTDDITGHVFDPEAYQSSKIKNQEKISLAVQENPEMLSANDRGPEAVKQVQLEVASDWPA